MLANTVSTDAAAVNTEVSQIGKKSFTRKRPLVKAVLLGSLALVIIAIAGATIGGLWMGGEVLWGWLMGSLLGGMSMLSAAIIMIFSAHYKPTLLPALVIGGWIIKLILIMCFLLVIRGMDFYSKPAFFISVIVSLFIILCVETLTVLRTEP